MSSSSCLLQPQLVLRVRATLHSSLASWEPLGPTSLRGVDSGTAAAALGVREPGEFARCPLARTVCTLAEREQRRDPTATRPRQAATASVLFDARRSVCPHVGEAARGVITLPLAPLLATAVDPPPAVRSSSLGVRVAPHTHTHAPQSPQVGSAGLCRRVCPAQRLAKADSVTLPPARCPRALSSQGSHHGRQNAMTP